VSATITESGKANLLTGTLHGRPRTVLRSIVLTMLGPLLSLRLIGVENVPDDGPLLVASNHLSNADPIILEAAFPRPLFFVGKSELFRNPFFRWVLHRFGGIPVERGTPDRAAIRRARAILEQGIALGIYPEGVRSRTVALQKGLPGAGLIALQAKAPVLPVAIWGTEFFPVNGEIPPRRPKSLPRGVTLRFGSPFRIPERVDGKRVTADEATHLIMVRIAELLPERYHGVYGRYRTEENAVQR
jgi:1-acyl-sn-glycerol-3-phosphate acyltransferase